jgi:serine/threonine protein kinase
MNSEPPVPENDPNLSALGRALLDTGGSKPSGPWVPPTAEELHAILQQYEIVKMLGRGGMGAVYMGRQTALDRPVAIKILSAQLEESDLGFTERFKNEARAMGKLNHPAVVAVYEFGQHESGLLYIVMEFVDGTDVARMIAKSGRLHTEHAMAITAHVCDALAYAHERGIIHRDIKPANIMVGYDGAVKVADFGLAKVSVGGQTLGLTQSGMAMGTMHYMAPEALMLGTSVDHRADIYAVGVMLYQMLTGKLPQGMFKLPSLLVPGLDPRYDAIVRKALMEDRESRYQGIREMRAELDSILTQPVVKVEPAASAAEIKAAALPTGARPQRPGGRPPTRPASTSAQTISHERQRGSLAWLWVLLLMLVGGGAWYFSTSKKPLSTVSGGVSTSRSSIILRTPDAARILPLEKGQPRLYDSNPLRVIEEIDPSLAGWQFTSIPQRIDNAYEVSVSQSGTLYAFGGLHKGYTKEDVFGKDASLWKAADQAIQGTMIKMCYSREVKAGDSFQMKAFELQLAATQITLEITPAAAEHGKNASPSAESNRKEPSVVTTPAALQAPTTGDSSKQATDGWISLFNGKNLSGWELHPSNFPADVFGGLIRIRGSSTIPVSGNMYYRGFGSTLPQWTDFELICTVMTENKGNSGIFLHSSPGMPDKNRANGIEVQIWNTITNASTGPTGSLQRITSSGNQLFKDGEWFQVKVRVEGKRVQTWLKKPDETVWKQGIDWTQPASWSPPTDRPGIKLGSGTISLQNNPPIDGVVWFKDIQFRELSASPAQATTMTAASTTLPAAQPDVLEFTAADPVSGWSFISTRGARWPEVDATGQGHAILESTDETVHPNNNMSAPRLLRDVTGDFTL